MILVNGQKIEFTRFPDGTTSFRFDPESQNWFDESTAIVWMYDGDHECILLWHLVHHIRSVVGQDAFVQLVMPYIPNARMDRVKKADEVFTLKWFADFINALHFCRVTVFDPHSIGVENLLLCYPDEGAAKRYSELMPAEYIFGIKHRDWRTGKIERLELTSTEKVEGRHVLIVDDICSRGSTFTHTARALKEAGAKDIYLYVSHCENAIFDGLVLTDGLIRHVFTTDSIYRGEHENITVIKRKE